MQTFWFWGTCCSGSTHAVAYWFSSNIATSSRSINRQRTGTSTILRFDGESLIDFSYDPLCTQHTTSNHYCRTQRLTGAKRSPRPPPGNSYISVNDCSWQLTVQALHVWATVTVVGQQKTRWSITQWVTSSFVYSLPKFYTTVLNHS